MTRERGEKTDENENERKKKGKQQLIRINYCAVFFSLRRLFFYVVYADANVQKGHCSIERYRAGLSSRQISRRKGKREKGIIFMYSHQTTLTTK